VKRRFGGFFLQCVGQIRIVCVRTKRYTHKIILRRFTRKERARISVVIEEAFNGTRDLLDRNRKVWIRMSEDDLDHIRECQRIIAEMKQAEVQHVEGSSEWKRMQRTIETSEYYSQRTIDHAEDCLDWLVSGFDPAKGNLKSGFKDPQKAMDALLYHDIQKHRTFERMAETSDK